MDDDKVLMIRLAQTGYDESVHQGLSIAEKKEGARRELREILSGMDEGRRQIAAEGILNNIKGLPCWESARCLLAFLSFGFEISTEGVIAEAIETGKQVYVPALEGMLLEFRRIMSLREKLEEGVWGIREPQKGAVVWQRADSPEPILALVPALAFDIAGGRLGRGEGYYDRFIEAVRRDAQEAGKNPPLFLGFACREQIVAAVPMDKSDQQLDGLVTDDFAVLL